MAKQVIISPTLREKKRYVAFEVISEAEADIQKIKPAIMGSIFHLYGADGQSRFNSYVMKDLFSAKTRRGIIRINHLYVDNLKSALALIIKVDEKPAIIQVVGVSGILNKAKERYLS